MQAVILAAGKGSRLGSITNTRSKGMLPILGKPIVERIIDSLAAADIKEFILVVHADDRPIREHFERISSREMNIRFAYQSERLGMAHALHQAAPLLKEDFVLSACDHLVSGDNLRHFISAWSQLPKIQALLSLDRISPADTWQTGIVTLEEDQVTGIIEKPKPDQAPSNISSTPLYCFSPVILDYLQQIQLSSRGEYELQDAIQMLIADGFSVRGLFLQDNITLTYPEDLLKINLHFLKNSAAANQIHTKRIGPGTRFFPPVYVEAGVEIGTNCMIGPSVYLERAAHIGDNVNLKNVVVLSGAEALDGTRWRDQIIF